MKSKKITSRDIEKFRAEYVSDASLWAQRWHTRPECVNALARLFGLTKQHKFRSLELKKEIAALYDSGASASEIKDKYNVGPVYAMKMARMYGDGHYRHKPYSKFEDGRILDYHAKGWTAKAIADCLHRPYGSCLERLRRLEAKK